MKEINLLFTDLDSTILDENYSFKESAIETLQNAYSKNFVIIFTSSKTFKEEQHFAIKLGIPIIYTVENGSAIYIPENVFEKKSSKMGCRKIVLSSLSITYIRKILFRLQDIYSDLKFYENSSLDEIEKFTGLSPHLAKLAKMREYTETIFKGYSNRVEEDLISNGIFPQKGSRFVTIGDRTDKGKAAKKLMSFFKNNGYIIKRTIGIGDGPNDISLLKAMNEPYIIGNKITLESAKVIKHFSEIHI